MLPSDTMIVIPSRREPPLATLMAFPELRLVPVTVISDPRKVAIHTAWLAAEGFTNVTCVEGRVGMIPQSAQCYRVAHRADCRYFFRMDDDLHPKFFVSRTKKVFYNPLDAVHFARKCANQLGTTLNGFVNSSVRIWLGEGYKRSYGLIHGGAHLCISAEDPSPWINEDLPAYEDVYRSAAHRRHDGAVGRVAFIGLDKRETLRDSSMSKTPDVVERAKQIILGEFGDIVTCKGQRILDDGRQVIPNWRLVAGPNWKREER